LIIVTRFTGIGPAGPFDLELLKDLFDAVAVLD
jgi:hypothetical protein